ncbi:MAG TPA: amino-acid N-acetyltransferase [Burkholderiales bacterium]|nr:amino-acid N-acetyltransferase [Betaproteobacteria bacterium]HQR51810.1 amino-acid N-acetyltransferase [Burkholderiales bacterium]
MPALSETFVQWVRAAAPFVHVFRGGTFVIAFDGEVVADGRFAQIVQDLNLLASLGVRLVLVHGTRPQIDALMEERGLHPRYVRDIRVTDEATLKCVKEANGRVRLEIEALLSMGLPNSPMANSTIRVASGNFIIARPRGVLDGVDLQYSGEVRKVNADMLQARLVDGEIALVSPLGYSPTGEIFNLTVEDVAAAVAVALRADKLIFLLEGPGIANAKGQLLRELTVSDAEKLLARPTRLAIDVQLYLPPAIAAVKNGVRRAHFLDRDREGALLLELFSQEGVGSMLTQDPLETLRPARIEDVGGILLLIEPLEREGVLVKRGRELIEREIGHFFVVEHDGIIIGCGALYPFPESRSAELAGLAVQPSRRDAGVGERLLEFIEDEARRRRFNRLFALTTRATHWFIERGFVEAGVDELPAKKQAIYNLQRNSKVLIKSLKGGK